MRDVSWHPTLPYITTVGWDNTASVWHTGRSPVDVAWEEGEHFPAVYADNW